MARTAIPVTTIIRAGVNKPAITAGDSVNGHQFSNVGVTFIEAKNTDVATRSLTLITPVQTDGLDVADLVISILAGQTWMIGPFSSQTFNQTGDLVYIDIAQSTWEFRAFKI